MISRIAQTEPEVSTLVHNTMPESRNSSVVGRVWESTRRVSRDELLVKEIGDRERIDRTCLAGANQHVPRYTVGAVEHGYAIVIQLEGQLPFTHTVAESDA